MRALSILLAGSVLAACTATTLETPNDHPANPNAYPARSAVPPAVLGTGFDPFEAYPEMAGAKSPEPQGASSASPQAPAFTCVMHPEIVRTAPGICPNCGMKLVPKKTDAAHPAH